MKRVMSPLYKPNDIVALIINEKPMVCSIQYIEYSEERNNWVYYLNGWSGKFSADRFHEVPSVGLYFEIN